MMVVRQFCLHECCYRFDSNGQLRPLSGFVPIDNLAIKDLCRTIASDRCCKRHVRLMLNSQIGMPHLFHKMKCSLLIMVIGAYKQ